MAYRNGIVKFEMSVPLRILGCVSIPKRSPEQK